MTKTHYTYLITKEDLDNPMFYIGVRTCEGSAEEDTKYWGSSSNLSKDIKRLGLKNFSKKIISIFKTREEAKRNMSDSRKGKPWTEARRAAQQKRKDLSNEDAR